MYLKNILSMGDFRNPHSSVLTLLSPFLENLYDDSGNTGSWYALSTVSLVPSVHAVTLISKQKENICFM